ncbi:hypothetical protein B0H10DRAFT_1942578 [Mycena sp. CBHHK59/15]|nr:hypothetical protein B0H10DRAFT_1942578 [Mycena sp. CBHHK59/15]
MTESLSSLYRNISGPIDCVEFNSQILFGDGRHLIHPCFGIHALYGLPLAGNWFEFDPECHSDLSLKDCYSSSCGFHIACLTEVISNISIVNCFNEFERSVTNRHVRQRQGLLDESMALVIITPPVATPIPEALTSLPIASELENVFELAELAPGQPAVPAHQNHIWRHKKIAGARTYSGARIYSGPITRPSIPPTRAYRCWPVDGLEVAWIEGGGGWCEPSNGYVKIREEGRAPYAANVCYEATGDCWERNNAQSQQYKPKDTIRAQKERGELTENTEDAWGGKPYEKIKAGTDSDMSWQVCASYARSARRARMRQLMPDGKHFPDVRFSNIYMWQVRLGAQMLTAHVPYLCRFNMHAETIEMGANGPWALLLHMEECSNPDDPFMLPPGIISCQELRSKESFFRDLHLLRVSFAPPVVFTMAEMSQFHLGLVQKELCIARPLPTS